VSNKFSFANCQLVVLPLLTLLISQAKALSQPCSTPISPVDVSNPTTVVGNGTPSSCTEDAFTNAIANGGIITFNCGSNPFTLKLTSEKKISSDTVIDGKNLVSLSGGGKVRLLSINSYYDRSTPSLTVQNINLLNGHTTDVSNTTNANQGGAAIYRLGGTLNVINTRLITNVGPVTGQDVAGGAIYSVGGGSTTIVNSLFKGNQASNGGAIGSLGAPLTIVNSQLLANQATGNGGNPGNGGNGGGIYVDGVNDINGVKVALCGVQVASNKGNAYGGGLFHVNYRNEATTIDQSTFDRNSGNFGGGVYLQGTNITMTNSTVSNNQAQLTAGMYIGPSSMFNMTNVTVAKNTVSQGLGDGIFIDANVSGTILNSTIANNQSSTAYFLNSGIVGGDANVSLGNTIIANNSSNCINKLSNLGGNLQYPFDSNAPCSDGVIQQDPLLGSLKNNGGPTFTMAPASNSPAAAKGYNCSQTDQRGQPRQTPCTLGAYELP